MKAARKMNGELIYATYDLEKLQKEEPTLFCPKCHRLVSICIQKDGSYYFRHAQRGRTRKMGGETIQHLNGKMRLYQWLKPQYVDCHMEVAVNEQTQRPDLLLCHQDQRVALEYQCSLIGAQEIAERTNGYQKANIEALWVFGERYYTMKRLSDCFEMTLRYSQAWGNFLFFLIGDELIVKHHITLKNTSRNMCYQELRFPLKRWQPNRLIHYWVLHSCTGAQPRLRYYKIKGGLFEAMKEEREVQKEPHEQQPLTDSLMETKIEKMNVQEQQDHTYKHQVEHSFTAQEMTRIRLGTETENRQFLSLLYRDNVTLEQVAPACFRYPRYSMAWHTPAYIWKGYIWHWLVIRKNGKSIKGKQLIQHIGELVGRGLIRPSHLQNQWAVARIELYQFLMTLEQEGVIEQSEPGCWRAVRTKA